MQQERHTQNNIHAHHHRKSPTPAILRSLSPRASQGGRGRRQHGVRSTIAERADVIVGHHAPGRLPAPRADGDDGGVVRSAGGSGSRGRGEGRGGRVAVLGWGFDGAVEVDATATAAE